MKIILSPSKTQDFDSNYQIENTTTPFFINDSNQLISELKKLSLEEIKQTMKVSDKIAETTFSSFKNWDKQGIKPALSSYSGEVFKSLSPTTLSSISIERANKMVRIISGVYGLLKPSDLISPYRLEMEAKWAPENYKSLTLFWKDKITKQLINELKRDKCKLILNLASKEYFNTICFKDIPIEVVTPQFKDYKNGKLKIISMYAKKMRGRLTRFILENDINNISDILSFSEDGYKLSKGDSKEFEPVFIR
jgi:cytoplasmic iron level regulating protein YaaA (DUF328/UPF0246 family)